jgi:hypothetical protein
VVFLTISAGADSYPKREAAMVSSEATKSNLLEEYKLASFDLSFFQQQEASIFLKNERF